MSKSPKSTGTTGAKSASRHSKTVKKPVTIDLEAEAAKVTKTSKPESEKPTASIQTGRGSVPKSAATKADDNWKPAAENDTKTATDKASTNQKPKLDATSHKQDNVRQPNSVAKNQSSGLLGKFAAALIGGVVALSGAVALQYFGVLGTPGGSASAPQGTYASIKDLNATKIELTASLKEISEKQAASANVTPEPAAIDEAVLSKIIDEKLASANAPAAVQTQLEKLQASVQKNSETLSAAANGDTSETLTAALASIAALKSQISKLESSSGAAADLAKRVEGVEQATAELASVKEELSKLQSALDTQSTSISQLANSVETGPDKKAAMAIAAAALKADVDRGLPFTEPLKTLQAIAGPDADFAELTKFAEQGVPNIVSIANEFQSTVSDAILVTMAPPTDNSLTSRLLAGAKSLVKVKQLSPVTGDTPEAVLSRIQAALSASKLQTASKEWQSLPEAGQAVSKEWHDKLLSRIAVNNLIDTTVRSFLMSNAG